MFSTLYYTSGSLTNTLISMMKVRSGAVDVVVAFYTHSAVPGPKTHVPEYFWRKFRTKITKPFATFITLASSYI